MYFVEFLHQSGRLECMGDYYSSFTRGMSVKTGCGFSDIFDLLDANALLVGQVIERMEW